MRTFRDLLPEIIGACLGLVLIILTSCRAPSACHETKPPVTIVAPRIVCRLPPLPGPLGNAIGFPAPDGESIYVSKADWAALGGYLVGLGSWVSAVRDCLGKDAQ